MSDLVGNPEDRFSHNEAQLTSGTADLVSCQSTFLLVHTSSSSTEVIKRFSCSTQLRFMLLAF